MQSKNSDYYTSTGGRIPLRWCAPEALFFHRFSSASDVCGLVLASHGRRVAPTCLTATPTSLFLFQMWSFGCLLYEVFADGLLPYQGMSNERVIDFVDSGKRLGAPLGCPSEVRHAASPRLYFPQPLFFNVPTPPPLTSLSPPQVYALMIDAWHPKPEERPAFSTSKQVLRDLEPRAATLALCDEQSATLTNRYADEATEYGTVTAPLALRSGGGGGGGDDDDVYAYGFGLLDTTYETVPATGASSPPKEASRFGGGVIFASSVSRERAEAILRDAATAASTQAVFLVRRKQAGLKADGTPRERYAISIPLVDSFLHHLLEQRSDGTWTLNGHRLPVAAGPDFRGVLAWMQSPHPSEGWKTPLGKQIRPEDVSDA